MNKAIEMTSFWTNQRCPKCNCALKAVVDMTDGLSVSIKECVEPNYTKQRDELAARLDRNYGIRKELEQHQDPVHFEEHPTPKKSAWRKFSDEKPLEYKELIVRPESAVSRSMWNRFARLVGEVLRDDELDVSLDQSQYEWCYIPE